LVITHDELATSTSRPISSNVVRITISQAAFDAIARTIPFGSVNFEAGVVDNGERYIWLPRAAVDRLKGAARAA
jgi:hypothetical protein